MYVCVCVCVYYVSLLFYQSVSRSVESVSQLDDQIIIMKQSVKSTNQLVS